MQITHRGKPVPDQHVYFATAMPVNRTLGNRATISHGLLAVHSGASGFNGILLRLQLLPARAAHYRRVLSVEAR